MKLSGHCLCGKIHVRAETAAEVFHACHCDICRTWGGGPLLAVEAGENVELKGQEDISIYNSSAWAERGFCRHCGTHLFYRLKEEQRYYLPLGLLKGTERLSFHAQMFIDRKPSHYSFAEHTETLTAAEFFAKFSS